MADYLENNPVTDEQIQATYDELKNEQGQRQEHRVRHILVDDEEKAKQLIADIAANKISFEDAAKQESKTRAAARKAVTLAGQPRATTCPNLPRPSKHSKGAKPRHARAVAVWLASSAWKTAATPHSRRWNL